MNPLRPFEPLGMCTDDWLKIEPQEVDIHALIPCQEHLSDEILPEGHSFCGDKIIHVVHFEDKKYISDGHHRINEAKKRGEIKIKARVKIA